MVQFTLSPAGVFRGGNMNAGMSHRCTGGALYEHTSAAVPGVLQICGSFVSVHKMPGIRYDI